jgi:regulator of replication initiation timing
MYLRVGQPLYLLFPSTMSRPRQTRPIPSKVASSTVKSRQTAKDRPTSLAIVTPTQSLSNSNETAGQPVGSVKSTIQKLSGYSAGIEESIAKKNGKDLLSPPLKLKNGFVTVDQVENQLRLAYEEIARATQEDSRDLASNATKLFQSTERLRRRLRAASDDESMSAIASRFQELFEVVTKLYSTLFKVCSTADILRHQLIVD